MTINCLFLYHYSVVHQVWKSTASTNTNRHQRERIYIWMGVGCIAITVLVVLVPLGENRVMFQSCQSLFRNIEL